MHTGCRRVDTGYSKRGALVFFFITDICSEKLQTFNTSGKREHLFANS